MAFPVASVRTARSHASGFTALPVLDAREMGDLDRCTARAHVFRPRESTGCRRGAMAAGSGRPLHGWISLRCAHEAAGISDGARRQAKAW